MSVQRPISASQLNVWKLCQRKRQFIYGQGLREAPAAAALAGTKVHKLLEEWVTNDEKPPSELLWDNYDLGRMAWTIGDKLPDKNKLLQSEQKFDVTLYDVDFTGVIDLQTTTDIIDFKTTSKVRYVKSDEELELDVQRLLYVAAKPDKTYTKWIYGVWEDYSAHIRHLGIDAIKDRERFKLHVLKPAEDILRITPDTDPLSLPPNKDACGLYPPNGCPFKSKCFSNKTSQRMTKLLDKLKSEPTQTMPLQVTERIVERAEKIDLINGPGSAKQEVTPAQVEAVNELQREAEAMGGYDAKPIEFLFIDSYPISGCAGDAVVSAHELVAPAARSVADDAHVFHPLLIDFKGATMLAVQLRHDLKGKSYKYVYLETKSAEGRAVMNTLMNLSKFVVKGMI